MGFSSSVLVDILERVAHGEAVAVGGFPDLSKLLNPKGGNQRQFPATGNPSSGLAPQDRARPLPLRLSPTR